MAAEWPVSALFPLPRGGGVFEQQLPSLRRAVSVPERDAIDQVDCGVDRAIAQARGGFRRDASRRSGATTRSTPRDERAAGDAPVGTAGLSCAAARRPLAGAGGTVVAAGDGGGDGGKEAGPRAPPATSGIAAGHVSGFGGPGGRRQGEGGPPGRGRVLAPSLSRASRGVLG